MEMAHLPVAAFVRTRQEFKSGRTISDKRAVFSPTHPKLSNDELLDSFDHSVEIEATQMQENSTQPSSPAAARIAARNKRLAMDWSLALASQGIHPVIEHDAQAGWGLLVAHDEYEQAIAIIRLYRRENLRWSFRKPMFKSGPLFDWAALGWVLLTVAFYWLSESHARLREAGTMDVTALNAGQWWRLFTATLLHADIPHLAMNAVFGLLLVGLAMGRYGTGIGLLAAFLAGAGGNVFGWLVYSTGSRSLGASGVVMGALGLVAIQSVAYLKSHPRPVRVAVMGVIGGVMLFSLLGLNPGSDVIAHLGGFASGLVLGAMLWLLPEMTRNPVLNAMAAITFASLVIWTWALALSKSG